MGAGISGRAAGGGRANSAAAGRARRTGLGRSPRGGGATPLPAGLCRRAAVSGGRPVSSVSRSGAPLRFIANATGASRAVRSGRPRYARGPADRPAGKSPGRIVRRRPAGFRAATGAADRPLQQPAGSGGGAAAGIDGRSAAGESVQSSKFKVQSQQSEIRSQEPGARSQGSTGTEY